jgi:hypothetical protein
MNNHVTPPPGTDCPRFADILPVLADRDDALATDARHHLAECAYCQAQQRAYVRLEVALRRAFGPAATPHIRTEDIMATLPNDEATPVAPRSVALPRNSRPHRILSGIGAIAAVIVVIVLAVAIFASHPHATTPIVGGHTSSTQPPSFAHPGFQDTLASISMVSPTEGWAVGQSVDARTNYGYPSVPYFLHDAAGVWQKVPVDLHLPASCQAFLSGVSMVNASDGWAVGGQNCPDDSLLLHYDGHAWRRVASPYYGTLGGVTMLSADDGWAYDSVTSSTPPTLLHYAHGQWIIAPLPMFQHIYGSVVGLSVVNAQDIWAAAMLFGDGTTMTTSVDTSSVFLHFLNGTWSVAQSFPHTLLNGLAMTSADDGWAIGYRQKASDGRAINTGTSFHYAHGVWTETPGAIGQPTEVGAAIIFDRPTDGGVLLGGAYQPSVEKLYHFTGSAWTPVQVRLPIQDSTAGYSFAALPDGNVWEVGAAVGAVKSTPGTSLEPLILRYSNGQWSVVAD